MQVDDDHEGGKRTGSGGGLNGIAEVAGEPSAKQSADRKQKSVRMSVEGTELLASWNSNTGHACLLSWHDMAYVCA